MTLRSIYPFTAIVGQDRMKKALVLNAINPSLGGVLIRGEKGTAKSTAARALAALLPHIEVVADCPFQSHPADRALMSEQCGRRLEQGETLPIVRRPVAVVDLPLGATEDRVLGTIDIEIAIRQGERAFEPGLLAQANRGILYVDEINLLEDHLVDILLDAAAMGVNTVAREGISFSHPARFMLLGTMNPEEGELRPQLLDRFGLCVDVVGSRDAEERITIVERRLEFERDPQGFTRRFADQQRELADSIATAQQLLGDVRCSPEMLRLAVQVAVEMETQGHRAELAMIRTAKTLAASAGRLEVDSQDVREAAALVLPHRMRRGPFDDPSLKEDKLEETFQRHLDPPPEPRDEPTGAEQPGEESSPPPDVEPPGSPSPGESSPGESSPGESSPGESSPEAAPPAGAPSQPMPPQGDQREQVFQPDGSYATRRIAGTFDTRRKSRSGGRSSAPSDTGQGRYVRSRPAAGSTRIDDVALDATVRTAATRQSGRQAEGVALEVRPSDIHQKVRRRKVGNTIVFVVDSSGSMGARQRMAAAKEAILSLLIDAYQKRDRVGLVAFRGRAAEVLLAPTSSVELARRNLELLPTGGKTPLSQGLMLGHQLLRTEMIRDQRSQPLLILVSDGRANVGTTPEVDALEETRRAAALIRADGIGSVVVDTETGAVQLGHMKQLAETLGASYFPMDEIRADSMVSAVRSSTS